MTNEQAQALAPSYLHLPYDGAMYRCSECNMLKPNTEMIKPFTPDKKVHYAQCLDCTAPEWLENAKDCGVAE